MPSYTRKALEIRVTLRAGSFGGKGNTKIIYGVPTKVKIEKVGPPDKSKATVECMGLRYEDMEQISTLGFKPLSNAKNVCQILAGHEKPDGGKELSVCFEGEIVTAVADFNTAPDIWFKMELLQGYYGGITAKGPTTIKGNQPAADFIAMQAQAMGYSFKNNGVSAQLNNSVFNGSPMEQAHAAAREVGAELLLDDGVMSLSPAGGNPRAQAVKLTKDTGLIKYPTLTSEGVDITALYDPAFQIGGMVELESIVPKASGTWRIVKLSHELHAFCPDGGPWFSKISGFSTDPSAKKQQGAKK